MRERTWDAARGKWSGILPAFGLSARIVDGKHHPCPLPGCGGRDRFRFINTDGNGTYICSQCGGGTGLTLLMKFKGWDFKEAAMRVDKIVGNIEVRQQKRIDTKFGREIKNALWADSYPVQEGDPVDLYLTARGLTARPSCLRTVFSLPYRDDGSRHPAMLAMFTGPDGKPNSIHRTWLTQDGRKAEVEQPRKMMPGAVARGGAIRLAEPAGEILGIAEGVETAMSATAIYGLPCWSAVSEGWLRAWEPPSWIKRVMVFGDHDANFVGQAAAYELARRLSVENPRRVEIVEVKIPRVVGADYNDILMGWNEAIAGGKQ